jgi:phosphoserine phosphatase
MNTLILTLASKRSVADVGSIIRKAPGAAAAEEIGGGEWSAFEAAIPPQARTEVMDFLSEAARGCPFDWCLAEAAGRRKRLLISDMDSTIIGQECLDELADFAGLKAEIAAITDRAMAGELNFEDALRTRVAMLAGLPVSQLDACYSTRIRLNSGARTLTSTMRAHGARCVLVSGGFRFFTQRVAAAAGFHADRGNDLAIAEARLTGEVHEPILGREAKLDALIEETAAMGLSPGSAIALGDGANDLAMIAAAGIGVAYRAKPVVAAQAAARIDQGDLASALFFQGYRWSEFILSD